MKEAAPGTDAGGYKTGCAHRLSESFGELNYGRNRNFGAAASSECN